MENEGRWNKHNASSTRPKVTDAGTGAMVKCGEHGNGKELKKVLGNFQGTYMVPTY
jgi:hypothetical protein